MTLDDIRKLSDDALKDASHRTPTWAIVGELADAVDGLLVVVDALPKCGYGADSGHGPMGSSPQCHALATQRTKFDHACDEHAAQFRELGWRDLPHAAALRSLAKDGER